MPAVVEIMATTPNSQSAMDSDKKRNKLGYHRTSVACVHCRRRKIRCLVAPDDAQGRCENCIRLRKECQFFPVDQQPPVEKKSRPNSRLETNPPDPSVATPLASSPTTLNPDSVDSFYSYSQMPLGASSGPEMAAFNPAYAGSQMATFPDRPMGQDEFAGHPAMEGVGVWNEYTAMQDPQMMATMGKGQMMNLSPDVWNTGSVPSIPSTSPMEAQTQPMAAPSYPMQTLQPDGTVWQVPPPGPTRTMSFPGQPDMNASFANQYQHQMPPRIETKSHHTGSQPLCLEHWVPERSPRHGDASTPRFSPVWSAERDGLFPMAHEQHAPGRCGTLPNVCRGTAYGDPMGHPGAPGHSGP
ncbi:hypothetical protein N7468_000691 [Penicillium chermesinum]|uniref:Zn(2)-C6 fungal-type domain-containing protein n=1 Tax=Penicillium chermesinum TaxID=63820 RepID=A0A9W9PKT6_9EURO|nr:uncharacterized protein N7468_000691 [Penicillium chermesinum]KAJ5249240.1 hypothetical protein N7468_000691 [Penicillium chermesinum]